MKQVFSSLNRMSIIITFMIFTMAALFYSDMVVKYAEMQTRIDSLTVKKIAKATDYRYKSIDNELALGYETFHSDINGIYKCFDISKEKILEYNMTITPFGKLLVAGNYLCEDYK